MPPFEYRPFVNPYAGSIGELLLRRGEIAAQAAQQVGATNARAAELAGQHVAGAMQSIGQIAAGVPHQVQQQRAAGAQARALEGQTTDAERARAARSALADVMKTTPRLSEDGVSVWDVRAITDALASQGFGPEAGAAAQHLETVNDAFRKARAAQLAVVQRGAQAVAAAGNDPTLASHFLDVLEANKFYPPDTIREYRDFIGADPENVGKLTAYLAGPQKRVVVPGAAREGAGPATLVDELTGKPVATGAPASPVQHNPTEASLAAIAADPAKSAEQRATAKAALELLKKPAAAKSLQRASMLVDGRPTELLVDPDPAATVKVFDLEGNPIDNAATRVRPIPPASITIQNQKAGEQTENRGELAEMVRSGQLPPSMLSRRGDYNEVLAEANRRHKAATGKPLNFAKLQLDYEAAKRFVGSMNSSQMVRFRGLALSVVNTIDEVKTLAEELKQGGIQKWNSAKRTTIQQLYGNTPQSDLANRYMTAVNTLKEEFANLANGGYAPTEDAWRLAHEQINGNFGVKDLVGSLSEVQRLINYRIQSFDEQQPATVGGPPSATAGGPPPARFSVEANGKTYTFATQKDLDAFKRDAGIK